MHLLLAKRVAATNHKQRTEGPVLLSLAVIVVTNGKTKSSCRCLQRAAARFRHVPMFPLRSYGPTTLLQTPPGPRHRYMFGCVPGVGGREGEVFMLGRLLPVARRAATAPLLARQQMRFMAAGPVGYGSGVRRSPRKQKTLPRTRSSAVRFSLCRNAACKTQTSLTLAGLPLLPPIRSHIVDLRSPRSHSGTKTCSSSLAPLSGCGSLSGARRMELLSSLAFTHSTGTATTETTATTTRRSRWRHRIAAASTASECTL